MKTKKSIQQQEKVGENAEDGLDAGAMIDFNLIKMASGSYVSNNSVHRKALLHSVSALCKEQGFQGASKIALETLTEILQSYVTEIAATSMEYCQRCHRTFPDVTDVKMALIDLGSNVDSLDVYSKRQNRETVKTAGKAKPPSIPKQLQSSLPKQNRPSYVPVHLPPFPDVHAYIRTPTLRKPVNEYRSVREKYAAQKKEIDLSLTRFMARTRPAGTKIFSEMDEAKYPLVGPDNLPAPYLKALITDEERNTLEISPEETRKYDDSEDDNQDSLKDIAENPYMKPPKKAKLKQT